MVNVGFVWVPLGQCVVVILSVLMLLFSIGRFFSFSALYDASKGVGRQEGLDNLLLSKPQREVGLILDR